MADDIGAGVGSNSDWLALAAMLICLSLAAMCLGVFGLALRSVDSPGPDLVSYEVNAKPTSATPGDTVRIETTVRLKASIETSGVRIRGACAEHVEIVRWSGEVGSYLPSPAACPDSTHLLSFDRDARQTHVYAFVWVIPENLGPGRYTLRARTLVEPELRAERTLLVKSRMTSQ